ncbi:DUF222 domain-containing protein, partial [Modestobacter excelsi]|uniref:DUF222 domain-containing protein n=1 Tax=Modestobacter excelsi TaxID=2213161 RepID=UPI001FE44F45
LPPGAVLDRATLLLTVVNRANAELTRTVRHADSTGAAEHDGKKTVASWLRGHGHLTAGDAGRLVRSGRALEHLPATAAAFAAGTLTAAQVATIAPIAGEAERAAAAEQDVDLGAVDRALVAVAEGEAHDRLPQVVHHYRQALDPDGTEPDPTEGRRLTFTRHAEGSGTGRFDLDAVGLEKVRAAIESIVQASRPQGDDRSRAQQQADALVQLCDNALAAGNLPLLRTVKPRVIVTVDIEDLLDGGTGPGAAETGFGAVISAAAARWIACDAEITRMVLDPDGLPLDVGREKRVVPAHLRRAVEQRDRHCVFTGCDAPPTGATSTTSSNGSATTARPHSRTPRSCANATTPRSTTASGSNEIP